MVAAICGAIPDIDILGWFHVPNSSILGHRALTHSLSFALVVGAIAAWWMFRATYQKSTLFRLFVTFTLAIATHGVLDALSEYSVGIEFFAPFSQHRYRFTWQPLTDYQNVGVLRAILDEVRWVLLPACCVTQIGWRVRRTARSDQEAEA